MATAKFGKLIAKNSCLFLCDMQVKFKPTIKYFDQIVQNSNRMLRAAKLLDIPIIATEQYPQGLGPTVPELGLEAAGVVPVAKTKFSMCLAPIMNELALKPHIDSVLLCGIEAHVCIQQTAIDLRAAGLEVFVIADACSSRGLAERMLALGYLRQAGCWLTSAESAILSLAGDAGISNFKQFQAIIKEEAPDSGLAKINIGIL